MTARLPPFIGIGIEEFDRITRFNEGRQLFLGSVIYPTLYPVPGAFHDYAIQFDAAEPLPVQTVRALFELVRSTVVFRPDENYPQTADAFYVPSFEQMSSAMQNQAFFASNGIAVTTLDRWASGDTCYSLGWRWDG